MTPTGPGDVLSGGDPADLEPAHARPDAAPQGAQPEGAERADGKPPAAAPSGGAGRAGGPGAFRGVLPRQQGTPAPAPTDELARLPLPLRGATRGAALLLVCVCVLHLFFLFLHVAPPNEISQRYARQVESWVYPLFEQNWRLFAPDPESSNPRISARTISTTADGARRTSGWSDLTAVDDAAVRHDPFPSHTNQNMLRRAWSGYLDTHGNSDVSYSDRAQMWQEYLRNIAVDRVGAGRPGTVTAVQLRVVTEPVPALDPTGHRRAATASAADTRELPWWKVPAHGH